MNPSNEAYRSLSWQKEDALLFSQGDIGSNINDNSIGRTIALDASYWVSGRPSTRRKGIMNDEEVVE